MLCQSTLKIENRTSNNFNIFIYWAYILYEAVYLELITKLFSTCTS